MPRKKSDQENPLSADQTRGEFALGRHDLLTGSEPGPVTFRLKPAKKAEETYSLKLTQLQRESMIHAARIKNKLRVRLKEAGTGTQVVGFTLQELESLNDELGEAAMYAPAPFKKRLVAVLRRVTDLLAEEDANVVEGIAPTTRKTAPKTGDLIYQFKITLLDIKPAIWRRIQVPDGPLGDLHVYIQRAFGWSNYHLHDFQIAGERYGPDPDDMDVGLEMLDEDAFTLGMLIPKSGRKSRWIYVYDFGDGWRHEVLFEGFVTSAPKATYPQCVDGGRACPPEDCGGPWGYANYLAAIADPQHERHEELLAWSGPFDPEAFDAGRASKEMQGVT